MRVVDVFSFPSYQVGFRDMPFLNSLRVFFKGRIKRDYGIGYGSEIRFQILDFSKKREKKSLSRRGAKEKIKKDKNFDRITGF